MEEHDNDIYKYQPLWGNWYIDMPIGKGSFGSVYKITREEMGHKYTSAVKIISIPSDEQYKEAEASFGQDEGTLNGYFEDIVKNIVNEVNLLYSLGGNSNIVAYHDHKVIKKEDRIGWDVLIRMEYVTSLRNYLSNRQMTREETIRLGMDICSALELCSKKGIIHRDIKDENIFVNEDGVFKIGDFGIARELSKSGRAASMRGTPLYMAPEVFRGDKYDAAVDIYSLGIVLYKLLNNGRMPFMPQYPQAIRFKDSEEALEKRMTGEIIPLPVKSGGVLGKIVLKACAYKAEDRYGKASQMKCELETVLAGMTNEEREEKVTIAVAKKESLEKTAKYAGDSLEENSFQAAATEDPNKTVSIFDTNNVTSEGELATPVTIETPEIPELLLNEETVESGNETVSIFGEQEKNEEKDKDWRNVEQKPLESTTFGSWDKTNDSILAESKYEQEFTVEEQVNRKRSKLWTFGGIAAVLMVLILILIFWMNSNNTKEIDNSRMVSATDIEAADNAASEKAAEDKATAEVAAMKAAEDRVAAEKAAEKAAEDRAVAEKAAEKAAEDRVAAEKAIENITIKVGDYVEYGSYLDEPILWRVMEIDNGKPLLWSEYILCAKCFDAAESGEFIQEIGDADRRGSNEWSKSNLREWLNSVDKVIFSTQPPELNAIWGNNNYENEDGFLTGFSEPEKSLLGSDIRQIKDEYGTVIEEVQDYVRLPNLDEIKDNGKWGLNDTSRQKYPTMKAEQNDKNNVMKNDKPHWYYLETTSAYSKFLVLTIKEQGKLGDYNANDSGDSYSGIAPVILLSTKIAKNGSGTKSVPWKLE